MKKRHYIQILLVTLIVTLLVEILFGSYLSAVVSTLPLVRKLGIINPNAPIVINRRETVRVSDSGDIHDAIDGVKSKLSTIVLRSNGQVTVVGAALNLSSDGLFLSGKSAISGDPTQYAIVLQDGRSAAIQQIIPDPASDMVLLKAAVDRVPVANFGESKNMAVGDRALFVYNSLPNAAPNFYANFVTVIQQAGLNQVFNADRPNRAFGVMPMSTLIPGEAIIDLGGEVVGLWSGTEILSSDVLRPAYENYFSSKTSIMRPSFGFSYRIIGKAESALSGQAAGAQAVAVDPGTPAQAAGLQVGDIITQVDGTDIGQNTLLEELLQKYKPSDRMVLTVLRNKQPLTLNLTVSVLK